MGQVPRAKPWLLLGDGRLATHLAIYLRQLGIPCRRWSRRHGWHPEPPAGLALAGDPPLADAVGEHDRVLAALADDALAGFVAGHSRAGGPPWVHFSGSRRVPGAAAAHPLCTFGPEPYAADFYPTIPFVLESGGPGLAELLPGMPNPAVRIPAGDRPLYHALCVMAGNFTTLLWQRFFTELGARWDLEPALALPYLRAVAANLESPDAQAALTGPIARGDGATVRRNLEALDGAGRPELAAIYRSFLDAARVAAAEAAA